MHKFSCVPRFILVWLLVFASSHGALAQSDFRRSTDNPKNFRESSPAQPIDDDCASAERFLRREYERQFPGSAYNADRIALDREWGCEHMKSKARLMGWKDGETRRRDEQQTQWNREQAQQQRAWEARQRATQQQWNTPRTLPRLTLELPAGSAAPPYRRPTPFETPDWVTTAEDQQFWMEINQYFGYDAEPSVAPSMPYSPGVDDLWSPQTQPAVPPPPTPAPVRPTPQTDPELDAWRGLADRVFDSFESEEDARAWDALMNPSPTPQPPASGDNAPSPWDALDAMNKPRVPSLGSNAPDSTPDSPSMWDLLDRPRQDLPASTDAPPTPADRADRATDATGLTGQTAPEIASDSVEKVAEPTRSIFTKVIDRVWGGYQRASGWVKGLADYFGGDDSSGDKPAVPSSTPSGEKPLR